MQDGIIKGTGNSRYLKTVAEALALYPTYEDFMAAFIAGTLPIDLNGINAAGWDTLPTWLNKANLLTDAVAEALGLTSDAIPNDAFAVITDIILSSVISGDKYAFGITVKTPSGEPVQGATISGVQSMSGDTAVTNENGFAICSSTSASVTIQVTSPYIDLDNYEASVTAKGLGSITSVSIVLPVKEISEEGYVSVSESATVRFSSAVETADFCIVGGGGGGGYGGASSSGGYVGGGGGGGGYVASLLDERVSPTDVFTITVGAGGFIAAMVTSVGSPGGTSSITKNGASVLTANGGNGGNSGDAGSRGVGGAGNGKGGNGSLGSAAAENGVASTARIFNDSALPLAGGGGGGGGYGTASISGPDGTAGTGGSPYGDTYGGGGGRGPGGGGAGGVCYASGNRVISYQGTSGAAGICYIRWYNKEGAA